MSESLTDRARDLVLKHLGADHPVSHGYDLKPLAEMILALAERLELLEGAAAAVAGTADAEPWCSPTYEIGGCFTHHDGSRCGEANHRTTGDRAWCSSCGEWCYPHHGCVGCRYPGGLP